MTNETSEKSPNITNNNLPSQVLATGYRASVAKEGADVIHVNTNHVQKIKMAGGVGTLAALSHQGHTTGDEEKIEMAALMATTATNGAAQKTSSFLDKIPLVNTAKNNLTKFISGLDAMSKIPIAGSLFSVGTTAISANSAAENGDNKTADGIKAVGYTGVGAELAIVLARNAMATAQLYEARKTLDSARMLQLAGGASSAEITATAAGVLVVGEAVTECVAAKVNSENGTNVKGGTFPSLSQYADAQLGKYIANPENKDSYLLEAAKVTKDISHKIGYTVKDICGTEPKNPINTASTQQNHNSITH